MESIPSNYRRYTGIVFDLNHFKVLDFLRKHRIVIVVDGFENKRWGKKSIIIKDKLDTMEQRKNIEAYKPRFKTIFLSKKQGNNLKEWWKSGNDVNSRSW